MGETMEGKYYWNLCAFSVGRIGVITERLTRQSANGARADSITVSLSVICTVHLGSTTTLATAGFLKR